MQKCKEVTSNPHASLQRKHEFYFYHLTILSQYALEENSIHRKRRRNRNGNLCIERWRKSKEKKTNQMEIQSDFRKIIKKREGENPTDFFNHPRLL